MNRTLRVAAVQLCSTTDVEANLRRATRLVEQAVALGAELVTLPENYGFLGGEADKLAHAQDAETGPFVAPLRELAHRRGVAILAGGVPERGPDPEHVYNTSVLIGPRGEVVARYRKVHLFDIALGEGATFRESAHVAPGDSAVVAELSGFRFGLSVCYDLRFPELYRALADRGAEVLLVPAAFTLHTGKDHWAPLLRARAIENLCYLVAPGQFGHHGGTRRSWGKSMIIDPWGTTLAVAPEREAVVVATIDAEEQHRLRRELPALEHRRVIP